MGLLLAALAPAPAAAQEAAPKADATQPEINAAIDKGVQYLLRRQHLDGSWKADEHRYAAGQTGLAVYTLLKGGLKKSHPAVVRGLAFIEAHPPHWTYATACCLMALETADPVRYADLIEELTAVLLESQGTGFSYPGHHEDLSLTQYGCLGLRAAVAAGLKIPNSAWEDAIDYALQLQQQDGSFSYRQGTANTGSMTAAGVAVLTIARDALVAKNELKTRELRLHNEAIERGLAWLGEHMRVDRNPDPASSDDNAGHMRRWHYYYLYGLERVGGLTGEKYFGERDWYREAANYLVEVQADDGHWATNSGEPHPSTCFAVLVLKRATAPSSGKAPRAPRSYGDDDPALPVSLRITGDDPLNAWISSWGDKTLTSFEWDNERKKGPRVWRVEYVDAESGEILATSKGDPEKASRAERYPVQIRRAEPGTYKIFARAILRPIEDTEGEEVAVESPALEVRVDGVMTPAMRETIRDFDRNQLAKTEVDIQASSHTNNSHAPRFLLDGLHAHGWLSKPDDAQPWIEFKTGRPQRGDHLVFSPYFQSPDDREKWGRPTKVHLTVNGKDHGEHRLDPTVFAKTYVPLKKAVMVRSVRIDVLSVAPGTDGGHGTAAGFAEIELQHRPDLVKQRERAEREAKKAKRRKR